MHAALWAHLQSKDIADIIACYAAGTAVTVWSAKPVTVDLRVDACGTLIDAATSVVARPYVPVETHAVFAECPRRGLLHHYVVELPSEDRSTVGSVSAVMLAGHEAVLLISKSTAPEGTWIFINGHPYLLGPQGSFLTPADGHSDADITLKTARQFYLCTSATYGVPSLLGPANAAYFVGDTLYEYPPPRDAASASGRTLVGGHLQAVRRSATSAVAATDPLLPWRWSSLPDKLVLRGGVRLHLQGTIGFQWPGAVGIQCADRDTSFSVDGDLTAPEGRIVLDARRGAGIAVAGAAKARVDVSIAVEGGGGGGGGASSKVRVGGALQCKSATLHTEGAAVLELDGGVSVASVLTVNGSAWSEVRIAAGGSPYRVYHTIITLRDSAKCWAPVRTEVLHLNLADSAALLEGPVVRHEARGKVAGASRAAITYLSSHRFATKVSVAESAKLDCGPHPSVTTNWQ